MIRIECENDVCDQVLSAEEARCDRCGHHQTTGRWVVVLALLYYPVVALLVGFLVIIVSSLFLPRAFPALGPVRVGAGIAAFYALLVASAVRRYWQRRRRIQRAPETAGYGETQAGSEEVRRR